MTTQFKFATYKALIEAGEQASAEMKELEQYLERTSTHATKRHTSVQSGQPSEQRSRNSTKRSEKVAI
ncbi:hypothetical protein [Cupriavidus taiwanensis]|uniref:Uncharacterized protein n=1 Tax=Cupriavidus taiwanensis TaxID=164546 RepID=A0A375JE03_9BURK|nr:hypothetical protein [Cupriavidus taiwanensis]SPS03072.1 hypothetical protein CBM2634_U80005 [Cupriavidus taiwanensis]